MGTCGLLCLAGPVSVGVRSRALLVSAEQERTVGAGVGVPSSWGVGNVPGCDSSGRSLLASSVFLRRKPKLEVRLFSAGMGSLTLAPGLRASCPGRQLGMVCLGGRREPGSCEH